MLMLDGSISLFYLVENVRNEALGSPLIRE